MAPKNRCDDPLYSDANPLVDPRSVDRWLERLRPPIALTGGTGFVGSHLVDTLCAAGLKPRLLVRNPQAPRWIARRNVEWVEGDLGQAEALEELVAGAQTVIHLAGVLRGAGEDDFMRGNRDGTARVVGALKAASSDVRFLHVSSQAAIGPSPTSAGLGPEAVARPISAYGRSKAAAEDEVRKLDSKHWTMLRPPAVYGPRDTDVFEFFRLAARGLLAYPTGERWITLANVRDVVRAALAAVAVGAPGVVYHVGEPAAVTMDELLRGIAEAGGVQARLMQIPPWVFRAAGTGASAFRFLGLKRIPLSRDKVEEILARHWALATADSLDALGLDETTSLIDGATQAWAWYRKMGWVA